MEVRRDRRARARLGGDPDLVDDVIAESEAIERAGLRAYADQHDMTIEACFETLLTGLAVRYYKAVAG